MTALEWTETTPQWTRPNPYRRHEATNRAGRIRLQREGARDTWFWLVRLEGLERQLPGGDLPDEDAKLLARTHLANELRKLLEELES